LKRPLLRRDLAYELGLTDEPWTMPEQTVLKGRTGEDNFIEIDWDKAIEIAVDKLAATLEAHGPTLWPAFPPPAAPTKTTTSSKS
jgi:anaerobic selenocysteine-containing dehydrogenase